MIRRVIKTWVFGFVLGAALLSGAMAGVGLGPLGGDSQPQTDVTGPAVGRAAGDVVPLALPSVGPGQFLVGTGRVSLYPNPPAGRTWQTSGCQILNVIPPPESNLGPDSDYELEQTPWPQSRDCIYLGGYDVGPVRPATGVDANGIWVKAVAVSDGTDTVIFGKIDATGYFYKYDSGQCADCGIADVAQAMGEELGIPAGNIMFASSHAHSAPDFLGGWGGVPDWYLKQARDAMKGAARQAYNSLTAATIRVGDEVARQYNSERRELYRSASDNQVVWLQARNASTGQAIATVANYAAHPTSNQLTMTADWLGQTEKAIEDTYTEADLAMVLESGLGNQSRGSGVGSGIASITIADAANGTGGTPLGSPPSNDVDVRGRTDEFLQPVTNGPLGFLGGAGLFDRAFEAMPAAGAWGEPQGYAGGNPARPCVSGSAVTVRTSMGGFRIGSFALMFGPGELFSNLTNAVKDELRGASQVMVASLANDELGYIIQSFEFDTAGQQGTGFIGGLVEYEEAFSIDRCFGDRVVEGLIAIGKSYGF